jgi:hypothetical protein
VTPRQLAEALAVKLTPEEIARILDELEMKL